MKRRVNTKDLYLSNVDCLDFLRGLDSDSVDLALQDPPYGIGVDTWDKQWASEDEYLQWAAEWTKESVRVLKPNRMLVVWGTLKSDSFLKYILQTSEIEGLTRQNEIIWEHNWGGRTKKNFPRKQEYAVCWSKGKNHLFNPVYIERKVKKSLRTGEEFKQGTIPTCVWSFNNHTMSKDFVGWHPTVKNLSVTDRMIQAYTNSGDTVLDSFLGSGTTAVAALRAGRRCVGSEISSEYFAKLRDRVLT